MYNFKNENKVELINELDDLLKEHKKNLHSNKYFYYDYYFHKLFFDYSQNNKLVLLYKQFSVIFEMAVRSLDKITYKERHREQAFEQHEKILKNFKSNDLVNTKKHIKQHYISADEIFKEYFK